MAQLISGDRTVAGMMLFGVPDQRVYQYMNEVNNHFSQVLTDVGQRFVNHAQNVFARMESSEAIRLAKAALRKINVFGQMDVIHTMTCVGDLQEAPNSMVPWIMSHPQLRQLHGEDRIDGYGNRYIDVTPHETLWMNPYYANTYTGFIETVRETVINDDGKEEEVMFDLMTEVLEDEDEISLVKEIDDIECTMIHQAHALVDIAIANKIDPTSYYDNEII